MAKNHTPPLACDLGAIGAAERPRYSALAKRMKAAMIERRELPDGYGFVLQTAGIPLPEVAEWISFERLCCPFVKFQLEVSGQEDFWRIQLTGPTGAKAILDRAFPAPARWPCSKVVQEGTARARKYQLHL